MHSGDYVILALIGLALAGALLHLWRQRGTGCGGCGGDCSRCAQKKKDKKKK